MKKLRIARLIVAAVAAALLSGGIFLLTMDDTAQKIKEKDLSPFMPDSIVISALDDAAKLAENADIPQILPLTETENADETVDVQNAVTDTLSEEIRVELLQTVRSLNESYPNAIGWIYLPGTAINYPIMQGDDNEFYLHHAYDNGYLKAGSVFLDNRCESRFKNNLNILYAHNMKNGSMFAGVTNFKNNAYFQNHRYGWLVTADSVNRIDFFAVAVTDWHDEIYNGFRQTSEQLAHIKEISRIYEEISVTDDDRLLLMSTCSYEFSNARTILIGKMMEDCA